MHAGDAEGIERRGTIVKKQNIGAGILPMARIDPLILAVVNPKPIKNHGHTRVSRGGAKLITNGAASAVHWNASEGPFLRARS